MQKNDHFAAVDKAATEAGQAAGDFRTKIDALKRAIVLAVVDGKCDLEQVTKRAADAIAKAFAAVHGKDKMDDGLSGSVRTALWQSRRLAKAFDKLSKPMQAKFRNGELRVSAAMAKACPVAKKAAVKTLTANDKPADKASDKPADKASDKPADKASDKPADKASDKPALSLNAQGMALITDWLKSQPVMNKAESGAFVALCDAIEAYKAAAVPARKRA